ncbi:hypothetical protein [Pararhizobium gei]|uniref:hypothetical protein n=1 Tax=Pararhizobium gei TaxID=1395951 RepID=UPI0023DAC355|nr:hypothetical protein [Rhizobium gei]
MPYFKAMIGDALAKLKVTSKGQVTLKLSEAIESLAASESIVLDRGAVANGFAFMNAGGDFADGVIAFEGRRLGGEVVATFDRRAAAILTRMDQPVMSLADD